MSIVLQLIGSLGFLLHGMKMMSDGIQKSTGKSLHKTLAWMTSNRFLALLTGMLVTMIIQSSGATTVMVVTFVNAGLMTLAQSVGVIFGANIGTTITAWIVAIFGFNFKIAVFAIPMFGIGYFLSIVKNGRHKNWAEAIMGFAQLFFGLSGLSEIFTPDNLGWLFAFRSTGVGAILAGFMIGIIITALLHSSSAFSAIVITMAYNGLVNWELAAAMTLGSNIGSTIDAVLASMGTSADARRSALIHVMFNVFGTILAMIFFEPFLRLVILVTPGGTNSNIAIRISMLHTVFKILSTVILLPMQNFLVMLSQKIIKEDKNRISDNYQLEFVISGIRESSEAYIIRAEKEISDMVYIVSRMFERLKKGFENRNSTFIVENFDRLSKKEEYADQMKEQLSDYLIKCSEHLPLTDEVKYNITNMITIVDELESMTDDCYKTAVLLKRSIDKEMVFPKEDMQELVPYSDLVHTFLMFIKDNINKRLSDEQLNQALDFENQIDAVRKTLKKKAKKRLEEGANVKTELLYIDIVRTIEKIGDHAFSIAKALAQTR